MSNLLEEMVRGRRVEAHDRVRIEGPFKGGHVPRDPRRSGGQRATVKKIESLIKSFASVTFNLKHAASAATPEETKESVDFASEFLDEANRNFKKLERELKL